MSKFELHDSPAADTITVGRLLEFCAQRTVHTSSADDVYCSTAPQVAFFTLIWAAKLGASFYPALRMLSDQAGNVFPASLVEEQSSQIAGYLDEWGGVITALQQKDPREWELLRIQMEKAVRGRPSEHIEDALQNALLKVLQMLKQMTPSKEIGCTPDIIELAMAEFPTQGTLYRFDRPFYPYAKRIAENQLYSSLRKAQRTASIDWDTLEEVLMAPEVQLSSEGEATGEEIPRELQQLLHRELTRLLARIQRDLTPKPRQVVLMTLAARPQFWAALTLCGVPAPPTLEPLPPLTKDTEMAFSLGMNENNLRVHRSHAKQVIAGMDTFLGLLLDSLMAPGQRMGNYIALRRALQDALQAEI